MQNLLLAEWLQRMAAWRRENMQCECLPELHMLQASAESCSRSYTPPRHDDRLDAGHKNSGHVKINDALMQKGDVQKNR